MKEHKDLGWVWPTGETHMQAWLRAQNNPCMIHGRQAYQGKKQLAAFNYVKQFRNAIDIGAHIGLWSYNMAHEFKYVYAFEPVKEFRECFSLNVMFPNVALFPVALGDNALERVEMVLTPDNTGSTHVKEGVGNVEVKTLDAYEFQDIDFIKIDTEGYELKVLRGARETILRCKPVIIVEQKRDMATARYGLPALGAVEYLKELGMTVQAVFGGDYVLDWQGA